MVDKLIDNNRKKNAKIKGRSLDATSRRLTSVDLAEHSRAIVE
jgi:hypothetical protein